VVLSGYSGFFHHPETDMKHRLIFFVLNATFRNISAISWRPFLVVEEAGVS
jgi:hypothetical protein